MKKTYTLEEMALQKQAIKKALSENQAGIRLKFDALFTPPPAETKVQGWMNNASRLFAVYDGVMTGYKLMRAFGWIFSKRKKQK